MTIGMPLQADVGTHRFPLAERAGISVRGAAANILASYLEMIEFAVNGRRFRLDKVLRHWPTDDVELTKPSASIDEGVVITENSQFAPVPIESSADVHGQGTVLWKTGDQSIEFQVDFYASDTSTLDAIASDLHRVFSPTELRFGVMLSGDPCYWHAPIRATLESMDRMYDSDSVFKRDLRLRTSIRCDIDEMHLRQYIRLEPVPVAEIE